MFFAKAASLVISFLATAYIARNLGPKNYGELSYAISFVSLFSVFTLAGIDQILYRDIIKYPEKKNVYMGSAFMIRAVGGIAAILLCMVTAFLLTGQNLSLYLIFLISIGYFFQAFQIINYEFLAKVQSKFPSLASTLIVLILNILKIIVIAMNQGVLYLALIYALESVLYMLFYLYIYKAKMGERILNWKFDPELARRMFLDSIPMIFSTAFVLVYARIDQVIIRHMMDVSAVGLYDAAVRLSESWYLVPGLLVASLFPAIVNAKTTSEEQYERRLGKLGLLLVTLAIIVAAVTTVLAPYIMGILYGKEFLGGTIILQIYIWAGIWTSITILANSYLIAENHRKVLFVSSLVSMVSNLALNFLLIPRFGIAGSAWATFISYSLGPISMLFFKTTRRQVLRIIKTIFIFK